MFICVKKYIYYSGLWADEDFEVLVKAGTQNLLGKS